MKSNTRILFGTAIVYLTAVLTASAQMPEMINVHLPVAAYFGATLVPAGDYSISQVHTQSAQPILEIESGGDIHFFINVNRLESHKDAAKTDLVLTQRGGVFHASKLELGGSAEYFELPSVEKK